MKHKWACRGVQGEQPCSLQVHALSANLDRPAERLALHLLRDAIVKHVYQSPHSARAIKERRWPPNHLNLINERGLNRHGMIWTHARHIQRTNAVFEYSNPISRQTAYYRPSCPWSKRRRVNTWLQRKRISQRAPCLKIELSALQNRHRLRGIKEGLAQPRGLHHNLVEAVLFCVWIWGRRRLYVLGECLTADRTCREYPDCKPSQARAHRPRPLLKPGRSSRRSFRTASPRGELSKILPAVAYRCAARSRGYRILGRSCRRENGGGDARPDERSRTDPALQAPLSGR